MVSIEDIINALDRGHINDPAERWMSRNIVTLARPFLPRARGGGVRPARLRPVSRSWTAHDQLVGVITRGDITFCLMQHLEKRAEEAAARKPR